MKSRIWLDFSTDKKANGSWEQLIRRLHGRPENFKPPRGRRPSYLDEDGDEDLGAIRARFRSLQPALLGDARGVDLRRSDFLDSCMEYVDELRIREQPDEEALGTRVIGDCRKLVVVRDALVDWITLEMADGSRGEWGTMLTDTLERLLELKARPAEVTRWNDDWFGAHSVFVYETCLYIVAALIRAHGFDVLRTLFKTHYLMPETDRYGEENFCRFHRFHGHSRALSEALKAPEGRRYLSPEAELFKRSDQKRHRVQGHHGGRAAHVHGDLGERGRLVVSGNAELRRAQLGATAVSAGNAACGFPEGRVRGRVRRRGCPTAGRKGMGRRPSCRSTVRRRA